MNARTVAAAAPLMALIVVAVVLRGSPEVVRLALTGAFAYLAVVALSVVRRAWSDEPRSSHGANGRTRENPVPALAELESAIRLACSAGLQYQHRLQPVLTRIARQRLQARGISWENQPEKVEELLGTQTWELLKPREGFPDRAAPGVALTEIDKVVRRIEEV